MNEKPLVSVIVPVYNVEDYVRECVDSILNQSYADLEVILVDDGSTDSSGAICDEYKNRDSRVTVLHKENGGLSDARNHGLAHAHGDWVSFIDSDDWVSPIFIEALLDAALDTGCPIAAVPFGDPFQDGKECTLVGSLNDVPRPHIFDSHEVQRLMLYQQLDNGATWRLYQRNTLGVDPFPKGLYYEDLASVYKIIHRVDRIAVVDCRRLYAYRMRRTSIIRQNYRHLKGESARTVAGQLYRDVTTWYPDLARAASSRCFSLCRMVFAQIPDGRKATQEERNDRAFLWGILAYHRHTVLHDPYARKRERLAALIACMGEGLFTLFCKACRRMGMMR